MSFPQQRRAGQPRLHPPCGRVKAHAGFRSKFHAQLRNFSLDTVFEQIKHVGNTPLSSSIRRRPIIGTSFSALMAPWNAACSTMWSTSIVQDTVNEPFLSHRKTGSRCRGRRAGAGPEQNAPSPVHPRRRIGRRSGGNPRAPAPLPGFPLCAARDRRPRQHPAARGLLSEHRELCGHGESAGRDRRPFAGQRPFCRRRLHGPARHHRGDADRLLQPRGQARDPRRRRHADGHRAASPAGRDHDHAGRRAPRLQRGHTPHL